MASALLAVLCAEAHKLVFVSAPVVLSVLPAGFAFLPAETKQIRRISK